MRSSPGRSWGVPIPFALAAACSVPETAWLAPPEIGQADRTAILIVDQSGEVSAHAFALDGEIRLRPPLALEGYADVVLVLLDVPVTALGIEAGPLVYPGVGEALPPASAIFSSRLAHGSLTPWQEEDVNPALVTQLRLPGPGVDPCRPLEVSVTHLGVNAPPLFLQPLDDRTVLVGLDTGEVFSVTATAAIPLTLEPEQVLTAAYRDERGQLWVSTRSAEPARVWRATLEVDRLMLAPITTATDGPELSALAVEDDGARVLGLSKTELVEHRDGRWRSAATFGRGSQIGGMARDNRGDWIAVVQRATDIVRLSPDGVASLEQIPGAGAVTAVALLEGHGVTVGSNDGGLYSEAELGWVSFADVGVEAAVQSLVALPEGLLVGSRNGFGVHWDAGRGRCPDQLLLSTVKDLTGAVPLAGGAALAPLRTWTPEDGDAPVVFVQPTR